MSLTVTVKLHEAALFAASRAVQVTVVTPSGKLDPEAGEQVTVGFAVQLSFAVGVLNVTGAVQFAPALAV